MKSEKESLIDSRDFWQESARYDRKQFLASFVMAAAGLTLAGAGIGALTGGDVGGVLELVVGGGVAVAFGKMGISEVQDFADSTAQTAVKQSHIDELTEV